MKPPEQQSSQQSDRPSTSDLLTTDSAKPSSATRTGSVSSQSLNRPGTSDVTDQSTAQRPLSGAFDTTRKDTSFESDSDSDTSNRPPVDLYPEEGELSNAQEVSFTDPDQSLSEEQSYTETMRGIRSYMGWTHIPDVDAGVKTSDDNPFAGPKLQVPGKVSVNLPTDEWLVNKLSKLNVTLVQVIPHVQQRQAVFRGTSLSDRPNPNLNGMGYTLLQRKTLVIL